MTFVSLADVVKAYDVRGIVPDQLDARVTRALGAAFAEVVVLGHDNDDDNDDNNASDHEDDSTGSNAKATPACVVGHDMRAPRPSLAAAFADGAAAQRRRRHRSSALLHRRALLRLRRAGPARRDVHREPQPRAVQRHQACRAGARPIGQDSGLAEIRDLAQRLLDDGATRRPADAPAPSPSGDILADYAAVPRGRSSTSPASARSRSSSTPATAWAATPCRPSSAPPPGCPLPLDVVPLYFELDGTFPNHEANPLEPENLRDLQEAVVEHGADIGLAFDGDADRCFVIDERGEPVSPVRGHRAGRDPRAGPRHPRSRHPDRSTT